LKRLELVIEGSSKNGNQFVRIEYPNKNNNENYQLKLFNKIIPNIKIKKSHLKTFSLDNFNLQTSRISFNSKGKLVLNITYSYIKPIKLYNTNRSKGTIGIDIGPKEIAISLVKNDGNPLLYKHYPIGNLLDKKSENTNREISLILDEIIQLGIDNGFYHITIEDLELVNKNYGNKNLNRLLNKFPREIFKSLIISKTSRKGIKLKIVNPAYTSIIGLFKYSHRDNLSTNHNSNSKDLSAALVIGRRGLGFREKFKINIKSNNKNPSVKELFSESVKELNNLNNRDKNYKLWNKLNKRFSSIQTLTAYLDVKKL
jgi:IS605 OrfB family transposase